MKLKYLLTLALAAFGFAACQLHPEEEIDNPALPEDTIPMSVDEEDDTVLGIQAPFLLPVAYHGCFINCSWALQQPEMLSSSSVESPITARPTITYSPNNNGAYHLSIDYGSEGIIGQDGLLHRGVLSFEGSGAWTKKGSMTMVEYESEPRSPFRVYGQPIGGTQTIKSLGLNSRGNPVWQNIVTDGWSDINPDARYSENTQRELVSGYVDGEWDEHFSSQIYCVRGALMYSAPNAWGYLARISETKPLIMAAGDLYPTDGILNISFDPELVINPKDLYENSTVDDTYVIKECTLTFLGKGDRTQTFWARVDFKICDVMPWGFRFRFCKSGIDMDSFRFDIYD